MCATGRWVRRVRRGRLERELAGRLEEVDRRLDDLEAAAERLRKIERAAQYAGTALLTPSGVLDLEPPGS